MKQSEINVLDEEEEESILLLEKFGMNRSMAKILVCLALQGECNSREIEISTGIKSSTVSIMLKKLREEKVVTATKKRTGEHKKGIVYYSLAGTIDEVLSILERKKMEETTSYIEQIRKIKYLANQAV